jgi:hypothetical protein
MLQWFPSESTLGLVTIVDGLADALVCHGPAPVLGDDLGVAARLHQTEALLVGWGGTDPGGSVTWSLHHDGEPAIDATGFTHLSLRVANLAQVPTLGCDLADSTSFDFVVELESETPDGLTATVGYDPGPAIQQMADIVVGPSYTRCAAAQAMRTIRIPLVELCGQGQVDLARLSAIRLVFPTSGTEHRALIDTIELTRDPSAVGSPTCPTSSAAWGCEVTAAFDPIETSCAGEPTPSCAPTDRRTNTLSAPIVDDGLGPSFSGWVVHTPGGWVGDPANPTPSELGDILGQCQAACALEWSDAPFVSTNCGDPAAWKTPVLRATPSVGPESRIPASVEDGSGLFSGQSLACNLEADCCEAFDEALCAARPRRPTPATVPLARGEEQRLQLGTTASKVEGNVTIDGKAYTIRAVNEQPFTFTLAYFGMFAADLDIDLTVPCGTGTIDVTIRFDLRSAAILDEAPIASIDTPGGVSCPTTLALDATVVDPDGDLASVRWFVDDVLVSPSVSSIPMTTAHALRLVARDARGATTTVRKDVHCL